VQRDLKTVPRHVAIVMDGNGRWAKKRFMPRFFGHKQGVDSLVRCVQACSDRGIEYLTVFAFSSENWKRPEEEISGLLGLVLVAVSKYLRKLAEKGVRIRIVGDGGLLLQLLGQVLRLAELLHQAELGLEPCRELAHDVVRAGALDGRERCGRVVEPRHVTDAHALLRAKLEAEEILERP